MYYMSYYIDMGKKKNRVKYDFGVPKYLIDA